jgi:RNA polymerase sigma-70 factor, ECF subfamily
VTPTSAETSPGATDAYLWDRVRDGDAAALGELYDRHAAAVYGFAFRRTASWTAAEDVLQTTFLRAWRTLTSGRHGPLRGTSARGWLLVVAGSECRNAFRAARRMRQLVERLPAPEAGPDHATEVARRVDDQRRMSAVRQAVDKLPRHERETLELVTWAGLSIAETAAALGVPEGTVKARLHRARKRLPDLVGPIRLAEENS